jgi:hypothetical protein
MVNCPDGENIQDYGDYKYLGIPIDSSLKMSSYFDQLNKKVNRLTVFTYNYYLQECSIATRLQLFKTYTKPHIDYVIEIWQLEKLNKRSLNGMSGRYSLKASNRLSVLQEQPATTTFYPRWGCSTHQHPVVCEIGDKDHAAVLRQVAIHREHATGFQGTHSN